MISVSTKVISEKYIAFDALCTVVIYNCPTKGSVVSILFVQVDHTDKNAKINEQTLVLSKDQCSDLLWHKLMLRGAGVQSYLPLCGFYKTTSIFSSKDCAGVELELTSYSVGGQKGDYDVQEKIK